MHWWKSALSQRSPLTRLAQESQHLPSQPSTPLTFNVISAHYEYRLWVNKGVSRYGRSKALWPGDHASTHSQIRSILLEGLGAENAQGEVSQCRDTGNLANRAKLPWQTSRPDPTAFPLLLLIPGSIDNRRCFALLYADTTGFVPWVQIPGLLRRSMCDGDGKFARIDYSDLGCTCLVQREYDAGNETGQKL